ALAEVRFNSGGYCPEYGLGDASRGERDDHANGFAGPVLGEAGRRLERKQRGAQECQNISHRRMLRLKKTDSILLGPPMSGNKFCVLFVCTGNICRSPTAEAIF